LANTLTRARERYRKGGAIAAARGVEKDLLTGRNWIGDAVWSIRRHRRVFSEFPNLLAPRRFNECLLRLKLSGDGRSPLRARVSDKDLAKKFVEAKLGAGLSARTFAVLRSEREVMNFRFPPTCAIKPTHASGLVILRRNEASEPDVSRILQWLAINYYDVGREPNYRRLEPKVMVEELLVETEKEVPLDYKVFCFHGSPAFVQVDIDRFSAHRRAFYSPRWRELDFGLLYPRPSGRLPRPPLLERMFEAARSLAEDFSFVRVDFYLFDSRLVVGELTSFPENCGARFEPDRADHLAGRLFQDSEADVEQLFGIREGAAS